MGAHPVALGNPSAPNLDSETVKAILDRSCDNPIISKIRSNKNDTITELFPLPDATKEEINFIMKKIDPSKYCGPDKIPTKIAKMCADILDGTFASLINDMVSKNGFPTNAKNANVPPIYKKDGRSNKINYRPVS